MEIQLGDPMVFNDSMEFNGNSMEIPMEIQWRFNGDSMEIQWRFNGDSMEIQWSFMRSMNVQ
jgi:hypothetical protein